MKPSPASKANVCRLNAGRKQIVTDGPPPLAPPPSEVIRQPSFRPGADGGDFAARQNPCCPTKTFHEPPDSARRRLRPSHWPTATLSRLVRRRSAGRIIGCGGDGGLFPVGRSVLQPGAVPQHPRLSLSCGLREPTELKNTHAPRSPAGPSNRVNPTTAVHVSAFLANRSPQFSLPSFDPAGRSKSEIKRSRRAAGFPRFRTMAGLVNR
jgi:hypothetical protein